MFLSKGKNNELLPFQKGTTQAAILKISMEWRAA